MASERGQIAEVHFDAEAIARMEGEGPTPTRTPEEFKFPYDALDRQLMASMDWEGPVGAQAAGRRVRGGAISFAKVSAGKIAEQHGPRIPGVKGNGKA